MVADLEARLRAAMESAVADEPAPVNLTVMIRRRHRRHVARAVCACALAVVAVAATIPLTLSALSGDRASPRPSASLPVATPSPRLPTWLRHLRPLRTTSPLYDTVKALTAAGNARQFAAVYANVVPDLPDRVVLFVTDPAEAGALESAASKRDHSLDTSAIRVIKAPYSHVHLQNASNALFRASTARRLPFKVNGVSFCGIDTWPICGGLQVLVTNPAAAERLAAEHLATLGGQTIQQFLGVPLTFMQGGPLVSQSRADPAGG
jgi:hypothetical protein